MTAPAWRDSVVEYIRVEAQPADKFGHQPRLFALARRIGQGMEYDDDILFAAAWMHDLGVFLGHRPQDPADLARWDHVPYTIARARELLSGWGFPAHKLDRVAEVIRNHQPKNEPQTTEAILLRDADILEQLGAIGAVRALVKVGRDTRYETFSSVLPVLRKAVDELPGKLRLTASKKLAAPGWISFVASSRPLKTRRGSYCISGFRAFSEILWSHGTVCEVVAPWDRANWRASASLYAIPENALARPPQPSPFAVAAGIKAGCLAHGTFSRRRGLNP